MARFGKKILPYKMPSQLIFSNLLFHVGLENEVRFSKKSKFKKVALS